MKPEYINSFDIGLSKKQKGSFTSSVFYRGNQSSDSANQGVLCKQHSAVTYDNIDESKSYGLELIYQFKPSKALRGTISVNGNRIEYADQSSELDYSNTGYNLGVKEL